MPVYTSIVGTLSQADIAEQVHDLHHHGLVEVLTIDRNDTLRRRLRGKTDHGTDVIVALDRSEQLSDGAVLTLEPDRAIVVRMAAERWLVLTPSDADSALEAGYMAGNMHWRVRFAPGALLIAVEGPVEHYVERLRQLAAAGKIRIEHD